MLWLTWREIADFFRTWQGFAVAILGGAATVYYGPKKMLETWDWYIDRFIDRKVMDAVRFPKPAPARGQSNYGPQPPKESPYETYELAHMTGRSESAVIASLRRLEKRGKIKLTHDGKWIRKEHS